MIYFTRKVVRSQINKYNRIRSLKQYTCDKDYFVQKLLNMNWVDVLIYFDVGVAWDNFKLICSLGFGSSCPSQGS